jgi:hypothetical protein
MTVGESMLRELDGLRRKLARVEQERDQIRKQLISARRQNEYMLASMRKLYEDVRSEQSNERVTLFDNTARGR